MTQGDPASQASGALARIAAEAAFGPAAERSRCYGAPGTRHVAAELRLERAAVYGDPASGDGTDTASAPSANPGAGAAATLTELHVLVTRTVGGEPLPNAAVAVFPSAGGTGPALGTARTNERGVAYLRLERVGVVEVQASYDDADQRYQALDLVDLAGPRQVLRVPSSAQWYVRRLETGAALDAALAVVGGGRPPDVSTSGGSVAVGGDVSHSTINVYNQVPDLSGLVAALSAQAGAAAEAQRRAESESARLAGELGLTRQAVLKLLKTAGRANISEERLPTVLAEGTDTYREIATRAPAGALIGSSEAIGSTVEDVRRPGDPAWLALAIGEIGVTEVAGEASSPDVEKYFDPALPTEYRSDNTPWICAFVHWVFRQSGVVPLPNWGGLACRSWRSFGSSVDGPRRGALALVARPSNASEIGAAGFVLDYTDDHVDLIGGNVKDAVSVFRVPRARVSSFRWPTV